MRTMSNNFVGKLPQVDSREFRRARAGIDKSWTGRSLVSSATNTRVSRVVACTTHRTRVSDMRFPVSRPVLYSRYTLHGPETPLHQRRNCRNPQHLSG